jgi:hypothetical protein
MSELLTPGLASSVTQMLGGFFGHTYTRIPITWSALDDYAVRHPTEGPHEPLLACRYLDQVLVVHSQGGWVLVTEPSTIGGGGQTADLLSVPASSQLVPGDQVADIARRDGTIVLAGPFPVEAVTGHDSFGVVIGKSFILRGPTLEQPA